MGAREGRGRACPPSFLSSENEGGDSNASDSCQTRGRAAPLETSVSAERTRSHFPDARWTADPSQHRASLRIVASTQPCGSAAREHALAGTLVRVCVDHGGSTGDRRPGAPWTFEPRGHAEGLLALVQRMLRRTLSTESRRVLCTAIKISRPPREREQRPTHPSVNHWPKHLAAVARFMTGS